MTEAELAVFWYSSPVDCFRFDCLKRVAEKNGKIESANREAKLEKTSERQEGNWERFASIASQNFFGFEREIRHSRKLPFIGRRRIRKTREIYINKQCQMKSYTSMVHRVSSNQPRDLPNLTTVHYNLCQLCVKKKAKLVFQTNKPKSKTFRTKQTNQPRNTNIPNP